MFASTLATSVHNNFWSQAVMVSCMGSWNLFPGSFKLRNKCSAERKVCVWQLAGFCWGDILAGRAAVHRLWRAVSTRMAALTRVLCGAEFLFSTNKGLQSLLMSLVCVYPSHPWSTPAHASPSPFYFLLLSTRFTPLWNRWFPDASSKLCISSFLPLLQGPSRGRHTLFAQQFHPPTLTETLQNLFSSKQPP